MTTVLSDRVADIDLEIYQGEDFSLPLTFEQIDGTPLNLIGSGAVARIMRRFTEHKDSFDISIPTPEIGVVILSLPRNRTLRLPPASYSWGLFLVDSLGNREPKVKGLIMVLPSSQSGATP